MAVANRQSKVHEVTLLSGVEDWDTVDPIEKLTVRELEVLQCVAFGMSSEGAGKLLNISKRTVEIHRGHLMRKLGARSSAEAVRIAMMLGVEFQSNDKL